MSLEAGDLIGGRYELGRQLGRGGMARVYLAHDRLLDREVAVKVLSEPYASDPQFVERFRREASAAAGLSHPNIVAVYDRGEADGRYYIVMEYLSGPDLKQVIRRRAPMPPLQSIDYAQQILAALAAAHRRDVIHRDVKPQNVLVAEDGTLKVTDFGIARAGHQTEMTEAGAVIGTAQYISPEQARGDEVTAASDTYCVGIVLYEMLSGRVPFDGERPVAVAMKQISDEPQPLRTVEPSVPLELEAVVMKALNKRAGERYRTAEEFSRALTEAQRAIESHGTTRILIPPDLEPPTEATRVLDQPTEATRVAPARPQAPRTPPPRTPPAEPPPHRRRWPVVVGALVLVAAIVVAAFALLSGGGGADKVQVPAVANTPEAQATATLKDAGFQVRVTHAESAVVEEGNAIGTEPPAGAMADEGSTVTLRISSGAGMVDVPDVVNDQLEDAQRELSAAGFEISVNREADDEAEEGVVTAQDPQGGSQAPSGSTVTLTVSSGPEQVSVPDVRQRPQSEAESILRDADLVPRVTTRTTSDFDAGTVVEQDPGPTTMVSAGSTVTIVVATAPPDTTVPSGVVGLDADSARSKLQTAGFNVISDTDESSTATPGTVIAVSPPEGSSVRPGATLTITVAVAPETTTGETATSPSTTGGAQPPPP
ncbi:MAG: Stk1 family PASTA domain-containing Ser/Thr kinase [Thermoleophilia bacterium]